MAGFDFEESGGFEWVDTAGDEWDRPVDTTPVAPINVVRLTRPRFINQTHIYGFKIMTKTIIFKDQTVKFSFKDQSVKISFKDKSPKHRFKNQTKAYFFEVRK